MSTSSNGQDAGSRSLLIGVAWLSILLVSDLPDILCGAMVGSVPGWLGVAKALILAILVALCLAARRLRALLPYAVVMAVFFAALSASNWVRGAAWWGGLVGAGESSFTLAYLRPYVRDVGVAIAVVAALWLVLRRRDAMLLGKGQLDAPVTPIRWLGIGEGASWRTVAPVVAVVAALAVGVPTLLAMRPTADELIAILPILPAVLLFAAINAFTEEVSFRVSLLATLPGAIGRSHALAINVVFFGLAHYLFGSPPGVVGAVMTGFLAWLLGRCLLETRGLLWPWFIHFLPDVVIFASYALAWIRQ